MSDERGLVRRLWAVATTWWAYHCTRFRHDKPGRDLAMHCALSDMREWWVARIYFRASCCGAGHICGWPIGEHSDECDTF